MLLPLELIAQSKSSFIISSPKSTSQIIVDKKEHAVVQIASKLLASDVQQAALD
jgi:hypothetical protein